jgi:uncharacterized protein (TIGR03437 family)
MLWLRSLSFLLVPATLCAQQLTFATYWGGSGTEATSATAFDSAGNLYLAGATDSSDFPAATIVGTLSSATTTGGGFVVKLDSTGRQLASLLIAGIAINALAVDASNNVFIAGTMPVGMLTPSKGAYSTPQGTGFVAKLNSTLSQILWTSTFSASPATLALDVNGFIYLAGSAAAGFATTAGALQAANNGALDAFVLKLSADGFTALYATFLGGSGNDAATAIAVDSAGQVYLTGATASADFPLALAAQKSFGGALSYYSTWYGDAFVAKLDPKGASLVYSTYLGGAAADQGNAIAVDGSGNAYVAGGTESASWLAGPAKGTYQTTYSGPAPDPNFPFASGDAFVAKMSSAGVLVWYTYLGGSTYDAATAIALDKSGNIYLAGNTDSADFPKAGAQVHDCHIGGRPFLAEFDPNGKGLLLTAGLPGIGYDQVYAMAFDAAHSLVYLAGDAASQVFFATPGVAQTSFAGGDADAFAARIDLSLAPSLVVSCVLNGASFMAGNTASFPTGAVAPGQIVSLFGVGLGPATGVGTQLTNGGSTVSTALGGTQVLFDGIPAPLLYAGANQANAVVPYGVKPPFTSMIVQRGGLQYGPIPMPVVAAVPAIFTAGDPSNPSEAAVFNLQDYTYNAIANPAVRGSIITFYATGAGLMTANSDGAVTPATPPWPVPQLPVTVTIRGINATVLYAGAAPGDVSGVLQINVYVPGPDLIDFGDHVPLFLYIGAYSSQDNVTIAVQ